MIRRNTVVLPTALVAALALAACSDRGVTPPQEVEALRITANVSSSTSDAIPDMSTGDAIPDMSTSDAISDMSTSDAILDMMDAANARLAAEGANYLVGVVEIVTPAGGGEAGATIITRSLGNKQLGHDFVPFDPRRAGWSGSVAGATDNIRFAIDQTFDAVPPLGGLSAAQTTAAILSAMATWQAVKCSQIPLSQGSSFGLDLGVFAFLFGLGGSPFVVSDIMHAGWRDINFAGNVIAATATFIFIAGPGGPPTDIDGNGKLDTAFREIYYDRSFSWAVTGANIDVETVALHEVGHGLSQAHFGNIFIRNKGFLDASPRAVMNALYQGVLRSPLGTDNGGHCSNWANWPNN